MTAAPDQATDETLLHDYGTSAVKIEPGGIERIPLSERHGRPWHLFTVWASPNLEFATVFVGVIGVLYFGLSFWQCVAAVLLGNALGGLSQGVLTTWGPRHGLAQMVLSRTAFGYLGNVLPAGINAIIAGVGWFAVNSISGAYALATLTHLDVKVTLAIVILAQLAIAFFGHNLIQLFERVAFPLLAVVFVLGAISTFAHAHLGTPGTAGTAQGLPTVGAFLIEVAAAFGYTAGWNPYASDYSRYLRPEDARPAGVFAGLGDFIACSALMIVGAASVTIVDTTLAKDASPTDAFTHTMPGWISTLVLLGIALGAVSANVLNIYSGAMSILALGVKISWPWRRGIVAVIAGVIGGALAFRFVDEPDTYENFLLIIAYWISPWLAIVLVDRLLRRGHDATTTSIAQDESYRNWAGPIAFVVATVASILLFSNQTKYVGAVPSAHPAFGDVTFIVGFVLAAVLYLGLVRVLPPSRTPADRGETAP